MIRPRDIHFIDKLTSYVRKNKIENAYTIGAILVEKRDVLSWGLNDYNKTSPHTPQIKNYIIPTHAEVNCLSKYISKRKYVNDNMTLYVVGLTKSPDINYVISSKPCDSCHEFIRVCGLKRVVYVDNDHGSNINIREYFIQRNNS